MRSLITIIFFISTLLANPNKDFTDKYCKFTDINDETLFLKLHKKPAYLLPNKDEIEAFLIKTIYPSQKIMPTLKSFKKDNLGNHYYRYNLLYKSLPLYFEEVLLQVDKNMRLVMVSGSALIKLPIHANAEIKIKSAHLGWLRKEGVFYLVYKSHMKHQTVYIDAKSGKILSTFSDYQESSAKR